MGSNQSGLTNVPWTNPPVPNKDLGGDLATERGGDPNITVDQPEGVSPPIWKNKFVPDPPEKESPNSVSGLDTLPSRFAPTDQPPAPPSLKDRSPGTIDER